MTVLQKHLHRVLEASMNVSSLSLFDAYPRVVALPAAQSVMFQNTASSHQSNVNNELDTKAAVRRNDSFNV